MAQYTFPSSSNIQYDTISLIAIQSTPIKEIKDMIQVSDMNIEVSNDILGTATLPIPNNIVDNTTHNWNVTSGLTEDMNNAVESAIGGGKIFNATKKVLDRSGVHIDPHYQQTYEGTAPRNFDCEWVFIPQNSGEAQVLIDMIRSFKAWASPEPYAAIFVKQPCHWTITVSSKIQSMMNFKNMVCTSIGVNYTPGGYAEAFEDGFPKQINLSMSFSERNIATRKDWEN